MHNPVCTCASGASADNCCDNAANNWNVCEVIAADVNEEAPFEMTVNGNLLIEQSAWNSVPQVNGGAGSCAASAVPGGPVICEMQLTTTLDDRVVLSWNEARIAASQGDNCGTLTLDVFGCPVGVACLDRGPIAEAVSHPPPASATMPFCDDVQWTMPQTDDALCARGDGTSTSVYQGQTCGDGTQIQWLGIRTSTIADNVLAGHGNFTGNQ